ncbi:uncharacterized protein ACR2FA_007146 [Aphomia sociella]
MANRNTAKEKEREFLIDCIQLYRNLPALWKVKSKLYYDRDKKNKAYDLLLAKYNEMFPNATKEDVKRKFNILRTNYRKELKKYITSMKSGASTDSIYESTLWYFEEMNFLHDQELQLESVSSMNPIAKNARANEVEDIEERRLEIRASMDGNQDSTLSETPPCRTSKHANKKARKNEQLSDLEYECLSNFKDEYYHWAMACAADLRKMEKSQQIYAKKAIAEVIMEGQLGLLHRHSVRINENTPYDYYRKTSVEFGPSPPP